MPRARMGAQHHAGAVPPRMAQQSWEQDCMLREARKGSLIVFRGEDLCSIIIFPTHS